ncbi:MAG: class I SAM-dependent methyltransferase [Caldilineaceae bacterium]|nr:class I SAM-dependent methyltransferase [Caldilineaceae bacterium]MBP8106883.1 class I SAM-dependent methyltransferase [Caldilineaceae bacterium]MBP8122427.1 class I SAM-dependent methyltransferase [Caldilineaceae bacterium]MBP9072251.1 class I SAM-dependent methyltransferase [Caldilineaceae bacterium]
MPSANPSPTSHGDLENRYYAYLRQQSLSSTESLLGVLRFYLPYLEQSHRVLDIGCGHGEFLEMLTAAGHEAVGMDIDPGMVAACRAKGLDVTEADVLEWLPTQAGRFDAIFSSNVMEHLPAPVVAQVIRAAHGALRPGGLLLIGVPNPESIVVQLHEFWRDATHVRLYSNQLLAFFFADAGFEAIQTGQNEAARWEGTDPLAAILNRHPLSIPPGNLQVDPIAIESLPEAEALPAGVAAGASLSQKIAFRLGHFVFQRLIAPFVAPLSRDLERLSHAIETNQERLAQSSARSQENQKLLQENQKLLAEQIQQAGQGLLFLHPSRETFVLGQKPMEKTL